MRKRICVPNEVEGREWCEENGYTYCGTLDNKAMGYIMEYDDGCSSPMSAEEEEYYYQQYLKEEREKNEVWVVASDDGINSRMYRSKSKTRSNCYTFELSEAMLYKKSEAQKTAALMTQRSRKGRVWFGLQIR